MLCVIAASAHISPDHSNVVMKYMYANVLAHVLKVYGQYGAMLPKGFFSAGILAWVPFCKKNPKI